MAPCFQGNKVERLQTHHRPAIFPQNLQNIKESLVRGLLDSFTGIYGGIQKISGAV